MIQFTVLGEPQPQSRHRHVVKKNFSRTYDPSAGDKEDFLWVAFGHKPAEPLQEPLIVLCRFYFSRPKSHYRTGKYSHILKDTSSEYHIKKPDADNLEKFVFDSLSGTFWKDDTIICTPLAMKRYDDKNPRTEVLIFKHSEYEINVTVKKKK